MLDIGFKKSPANFAGLFRYCKVPYLFLIVSPLLSVKSNLKYW